MSADQAKAFFTKQAGDPDVGFISGGDAQSAIGVIYQDMQARFDYMTHAQPVPYNPQSGYSEGAVVDFQSTFYVAKSDTQAGQSPTTSPGKWLSLELDDIARKAAHAATPGDLAALLPSGPGIPEGQVAAPPGSTFLQTDATNDAKGWIRWVKAKGNGNTGWVAGADADTGWRDVASLVTPGAGLTALMLRVRRVGLTVQWIVQWTQDATPPTVCTLSVPEGFRYSTSAVWTFFEAQGQHQQAGQAYTSSDGATLNFRPIASEAVRATFTHGLVAAADQAWPTTLPGTPA